MVSKKSRSEIRRKKHMKLRNRFSGTAERPRLAVFRSNNHMYAQIIDDTVGNTLVAASTLQKDVKAELEKTNNVEALIHLIKYYLLIITKTKFLYNYKFFHCKKDSSI